jgi:hypothetical protein
LQGGREEGVLGLGDKRDLYSKTIKPKRRRFGFNKLYITIKIKKLLIGHIGLLIINF